MPAPAKRLSPDARMVELLIGEKRRVLLECGYATVEDFEAAWERCWQVMVAERAWPHATSHRRAWRQAMEQALYPEARACFIDQPTGFYRYIVALAEARDRSVSVGETTLVGLLVA